MMRSSYAIELEAMEDRGMAVAWSMDGKLLAVSGDRGRNGALFDPRASRRPIQVRIFSYS